MPASDELIRAVKPTLFEATFHPELIIRVLLANLMSDKLDELGHHALPTRGPFSTEEERAHALYKLFHYLNGRFYHARPREFASIWGLHERENIRNPEALDANDYTMEILSEACRKIPQFRPYAPLLSDFLETGLFPEYTYPLIDVILALSARVPAQPSHPLGMTSCADECILLAALACNRWLCNIREIVFLGSPIHYVLFLFPEGSNGYFFNGKREFFTWEMWRNQLQEDNHPSLQAAFLDRIFLFDRIITPAGGCVLTRQAGSLSQAGLNKSISQVERFLGVSLREISPAVDIALEKAPGTDSPDAELIPQLEDVGTPKVFRETIRRFASQGHPSLAVETCYTARWQKVPDPSAYIAASLSGHKIWLMAGSVLTTEDALELVRKIPGRESLFTGGDQVALPDEVVLFQTAGDNERVLMFYCLVMLSEAIPESEKKGVRIDVQGDQWQVAAGDRVIRGSDL